MIREYAACSELATLNGINSFSAKILAPRRYATRVLSSRLVNTMNHVPSMAKLPCRARRKGSSASSNMLLMFAIFIPASVPTEKQNEHQQC